MLILGEAGILALAPPGEVPENWPASTPLPGFALSQDKQDGSISWWRVTSKTGAKHRLSRAPKPEELAAHAVINSELAQKVVQSTHRYYKAQVLEPSVRGFLGILEKQFPRSDLYIWELLQNAVDDGASMVVLERTANKTGLRFLHDGRRFTPLDVLGLCSVGLSTKAISGKKSIGFMGKKNRAHGVIMRTLIGR